MVTVSQLSRETADPQEVPVSPQIGPTPCDYPSLHSSQACYGEQSKVPSQEEGEEGEEGRGEVHPKTKRVLFASDLWDEEGEERGDYPSTHHPPLLPCIEGEGPVTLLPFSQRSIPSEAHGIPSEAHSSDACLDQTLEQEDILGAHAALVVS